MNDSDSTDRFFDGSKGTRLWMDKYCLDETRFLNWFCISHNWTAFVWFCKTSFFRSTFCQIAKCNFKQTLEIYYSNNSMFLLYLIKNSKQWIESNYCTYMPSLVNSEQNINGFIFKEENKFRSEFIYFYFFTWHCTCDAGKN